ncbi:MAG: site-specific tyrosine recombinase XerD [Oliverpabstia sp.]
MEQTIREFITYLHNTKKSSGNTEVSYERDLKKMMQYFSEIHGIHDVRQITETNLNSYMLYLEKNHFAASTISRSVASIRAFFQYLYKTHVIDHDPSEELRPPKVEKKMPEILTVGEVDMLLRQPSANSPKGIRDKAMMELLYATGIRVSELICLQVSDVNLMMGYINCHDTEKERIIPFGNEAKKALAAYLGGARNCFLHSGESTVLFTNCSGKPMSRQGFWKVLKAYASEAGIKKDITPQTLRHSFAAHLVQNGADLKSVQEMMGLSDISTTQVYMNLDKQRIRDVYTRAHPRK